MKYTFSGHETFQCKNMWLKKGYDFVKAGKSFNDDTAVVDLGVGKNMVASIKFWLKSFGIIDEDNQTTKFGDLIFADNGYDPFLEDPNTLWFLHFQLIHTYYATLYRQVFVNFHKERKEFSKTNIFNFIKRQFADKAFEKTIYNENTINKDIATLLKMYVIPDNYTFDDFSSVLIDLNLIKKVEKDLYEFNYVTKAELNPLVFLYAVRSIAPAAKVVEYDRLLELSLMFCLSQGDMYEIFAGLTAINNKITFDNAAGEQLFVINDDIDTYDVLSMYYNQN